VKKVRERDIVRIIDALDGDVSFLGMMHKMMSRFKKT